MQRKRAEVDLQEHKTYKTTNTTTGTAKHVLFLHLNFFVFSSPFNLTPLNSSLLSSPFRLLLIDIRNRFQNPALNLSRLNSSMSELDLSPSSSAHNDKFDRLFLWFVGSS